MYNKLMPNRTTLLGNTYEWSQLGHWDGRGTYLDGLRPKLEIPVKGLLALIDCPTKNQFFILSNVLDLTHIKSLFIIQINMYVL